MHPASKYTRCAAGTTTTIEGGDSFWCHGVVVTGTANGICTVYEADGSTVIMTVSVLANTTEEIHTEFIARNGMIISNANNITATVFHEHAGR